MLRLREVALDAARGFQRHQAPRLGAAIAFYTLLSLSPLVALVLVAVSAFFGPEAARGEISRQIEAMVGHEGARAVETLIVQADQSFHRGWAAVIGIVILFIGATGVFVELKGSLDVIWEAPGQASGPWWRMLLFERVLAFAAVCGLAFLLLVSLLFSAFLAAMSRHWGTIFQNPLLDAVLNCVISFALTMLMFAMIYKILPARRPDWSQVWLGAAITAFLFVVGKGLIGVYLGQASVGSAYGAAGSLVVLLVWVYYSTQIFLFGAELTRAMNGPVAPAP